MPRRLALTILCFVLGSYWTFVLSAPPLSGGETPAADSAEGQSTGIESTEAGASTESDSVASGSTVTVAVPDDAIRNDAIPGEEAPAVPDDVAEGEPEKAAGEPQSRVFAYRFEAGDEVHFDVLHEMQITAQYDVTVETNTNKTESRKHFRVLSVQPDGTAELELVIDSVRMSAKFGDSPAVEFDSKLKDEKVEPRFARIRRSIGKPQARMQVAPTGKLLRVQEGTLNANGEVIWKTSTMAASQETQSILTIFPERALAVGDVWGKDEKFEVPVTVEGNLVRNILMMRAYRLESLTGDLATISVRTSILTPLRDAPAIEAQLIQREVSGLLVFDLRRGQVVSRKLNTDKTVHSPFGPKTLMRATSTLVEKAAFPAKASAAETTAQKPAAAEVRK